MKLRHVFFGIALSSVFGVASAERIDGIEYAEPDNALLKRLDSVKHIPKWVDDAYDLQPLGTFGDGAFWISDKSVRRNWQGQVILKLFKIYDKPKFFKPKGDPFKRHKRAGYTATESIVAFDCSQKRYAIKAESLYTRQLDLLNSEAFEDDFVGFKAGSVLALVHQKYCF